MISPEAIVDQAHRAKNKRTREQAGLEDFDEEMIPEEEINKEPFLAFPTVDEDKKRHVIASQLKTFIVNHPTIDTSKTDKIDRELSLLSTEELERRLQNTKIVLGISEPNKSAKGFLSVVGFVLEYYMGLRGISERFTSDDELIGCISAYLPESFHWLGVPFLTAAKFGGHLSDHIHGKPLPQRPGRIPQNQEGEPSRPTSDNGRTVSIVQPNK